MLMRSGMRTGVWGHYVIRSPEEVPSNGFLFLVRLETFFA